jgi:hypothetical protein
VRRSGMRGRVAVVLGVVAISAAGACRQEEPAICRSSPPEDSANFESWTNEVSAADCKVLRPEMRGNHQYPIIEGAWRRMSAIAQFRTFGSSAERG